MAYSMYNPNNMYMQDLQQMKDRIDNQMRQFQQFQQPQMQQPTAINQTFQLAPNQNINELDGKYANNIDEVKNTLTLKNTLFIDKENKNLWFKNADGSITGSMTYRGVTINSEDLQEKVMAYGDLDGDKTTLEMNGKTGARLLSI